MKKLSMLYQKMRALKAQRGFTMIELLIVISILGILAVAVLSAINPLEQINRGRDTSTQSDAEQLLNAIERFNAFQGHFPWDVSRSSPPDSATPAVPWVLVDNDWQVGTDGVPYTDDMTCSIIQRLGPGGGTGNGACATGSNELKPSYINRVIGLGEQRGLYVYKQTNNQNSDMYICFSPQSSAFQEQARQRCADATLLPGDFPAEACDTTNPANPNGIPMVCLP